MPRSKFKRTGGMLVAALLPLACFARGAHSYGDYSSVGRDLSQLERHDNNIFSVFQHRQRVPRDHHSDARMIKTDDRSATAPPTTPSSPEAMPKSRCASHSDCIARQYCRQAMGGPVCSDCLDYRNFRCQDWQDSIDSKCTVCEDADDSLPGHHTNRKQRQGHHFEQNQQSQHWHRRENPESRHHQKNNNHHNQSEQTWSPYGGNLFWRCLMTALFIFGTQCFFWFLCFFMTSAMCAIGSVSSWCCGSGRTCVPAPVTAVYACGEDAALQAALAASLLSSGQSQPQPQPQPSFRATRCSGSGDGCGIRRCLARLIMIPVFMMSLCSLCCPLCTFLSVAFLCSSFSSCGSCSYRGCSSHRTTVHGNNVHGGSSSGPRFRCSGTTAETGQAPTPAATEAKQKQSEPALKTQAASDASKSTSPRTESATTLDLLPQEALEKAEPDEEDTDLQRALAASLLRHDPTSSEPEPEPQTQPQSQQCQDQNPKPEQDKVANTQGHDGPEGEGASVVAAGFVEVMHDDHQ